MLKKIIIALLAVILLAGGAAITYRLVKTQGVAEDYVVNSQASAKRLVIATQKSKFKDEVVQRAVTELAKQNIQIHVTDVTKLPQLKDSEWDGIIILTTVESGKIQADSHQFLEKRQGDFKRIGLMCTADSGAWKGNDIGIDAMTSASKNDNIEPFVQSVLKKSNDVLNVSK